MYSVHQHWDPLKVCAVGISYPPEFYSFIKNSKARSVMERIAKETEEDYQSLIKLLKSFNVEVLRLKLFSSNHEDYLDYEGKIVPPPMTPRDWTAMIGNKFYMPDLISFWDTVKGPAWPTNPPKSKNEFNNLPKWVFDELINQFNVSNFEQFNSKNRYHLINQSLVDIKSIIEDQGNKIIYNTGINTAETTRIGKDLYFGTHSYHQDQIALKKQAEELFPNYKCHIINTGGHADGTYCPVVPGLIISLHDVPTYKDTFPDWEVVYLPGQSWSAVAPFIRLKAKNKGKYWVPGEENNDDFTNFVNKWLDHWVGYVEETVFDVNILVIDEKNVICNNENDQVFEAFGRHGITPHVCNFRHRYFWDGGLHCITSDLHREGTQKDYFPNRT